MSNRFYNISLLLRLVAKNELWSPMQIDQASKVFEG